jgi:hypothetical protein
MRRIVWAMVASVALGTAEMGLAAPVVVSPGADIVLTDPLVRSTQIGPPPVGAVTAFNPATGVGVAAVPGVGVRQVTLVGVPGSWAGRPAVRAIDLDTGIEFIALLPSPPQLVTATVLRAAGDAILVRRQVGGVTIIEALPVASVFAPYRSGLAPATRVPGALRRGSRVLIPPEGGARGRKIVRRRQ